MDAYRKVIWSEGVFLNQQHFQCWDDYNHHHAQLFRQGFHAFDWGIINLEVDEVSITNGVIRVIRCLALLGDGRWIDYDSKRDNDELSLLLDDTEQGVVEVYIALPHSDKVSGITGYDSKSEFGSWRAQYQTVQDKYDSKRESEVLLAKQQITLLKARDSKYACLKIAEIIHVNTDSFQLKKDFIPACLKIKASYALQSVLRRISESLQAKAKNLRARLKNHPNQGTVDNSHHISLVNLLRIANRFNPVLQHYLRHGQCHPEKMYLLCIELLGELNALVVDECDEVIEFEHNNLTQVFNSLQQKIINQLEQAMPSPVVTLALQKESDTQYFVDNIDSQFFKSNNIYLAVKFEGDNNTWPENFAEQAKISSKSSLSTMLMSFTSGINLKHVTRLPGSLVMKSSTEYFLMQAVGEYWQQIVEERSLAIAIGYEFNQASLSLVTQEG